MDKGDLKGISLLRHLAYIVYRNIQPHVEKRSTFAHFTRFQSSNFTSIFPPNLLVRFISNTQDFSSAPLENVD